MNATAPAPSELSALLRLLDDDTPAVRERVAERLAETSGDLSEELAELGWDGGPAERRLLGRLLLPARRETLRTEWVVPSNSSGSLADDWDFLEHLLRLLSDFLHDGVTLRQSLPDALDLLAEEAEENGAEGSEEALRAFLFEGGRFRGNRESYYDPRNSDLSFVVASGTSNPIGLCLVYLFAARRLGLEVSGVSFPGHFLCRIHEDGEPVIVDCFDDGKRHPLASLLAAHPELGREQRDALKAASTPGAILHRVLLNLASSFAGMKRQEDAEAHCRTAFNLGIAAFSKGCRCRQHPLSGPIPNVPALSSVLFLASRENPVSLRAPPVSVGFPAFIGRLALSSLVAADTPPRAYGHASFLRTRLARGTSRRR